MNLRHLDRQIIMPTGPDGANAISAHRAFIYSACAPGAGDVYAGFRLRGYAILAFFTGFSGWLIWILAAWLAAAVDSLFGHMNGMGTSTMPHMPLVSMGAAFLILFLIWYGALLSAVDVAVRQRRHHGRPAQASVAWALAMSWLCPGTGQVYTGQRGFGLILFVGYILGMVLMVPAYRNLFKGLSDIVSAGQLDAGNVQETVRQLHILLRKVDFSVGTLLQHAVKWYAIANTMETLRQGPLRSDTHWSTRSPGYGLGLVGIGWLCPGAGQLLQGRQRAGWLFLAGYVTATLATGLSAGREVISVPTADHLEWLSVIIQWAAALEAPLAMKGPAGP
jgi:hypothetical protein